MSHRWTACLIPSLSFALACTPTPPDTAGTPAKAEEPSEVAREISREPVVTAPKPAPPKPKPEELAKLRKQLLVLLNEGRALTKNGDYVGGMAKYRAALAIDASDVAVLGELGWAAYKAGDLDNAHRTTAQALKFAREDSRRGMLLYNLGRIEQDRENPVGAIDHYRASLVARPGNATVQARLDALIEREGAPAVAAEEQPGLHVLGRGLPDLTAACKLIVDLRCKDYTLDAGEPCVCEPELLADPDGGSWGILRLATGGAFEQEVWLPVIQTDAGWTVFGEVLFTYNPGMFGIYEEAKLGTSETTGITETVEGLVIHVSKSRIDRDMGLNEIETEDHRAMVICTRHATGAACTLPLVTEYMYLREVEFPDEDEAELLGEVLDHEGLPIERGFRADFEFTDDGKLLVTWTEVKGYEPDGELLILGQVVPAGEHSLGDLLGPLR
jgi:tetratricopeptide (TPR) repeat protein